MAAHEYDNPLYYSARNSSTPTVSNFYQGWKCCHLHSKPRASPSPTAFITRWFIIYYLPQKKVQNQG